jgi:O-methyltransferase
MYLPKLLRRYVGMVLRRRRWRCIYEECRASTMIPEASFLDNLRLAETVRGVPGCVVECGVWRGGMSAGLCRLLGAGRTYYLFDSFQGLPPAQVIDGAAAIRWQQDKTSSTYYDNCSATPELASAAMQRAGASSFHLVKGWFNETLPAFSCSEPVALLRLDGDWYDSTMICLESLFDRVPEQGIIILDDYYAWDGCSRALHDFLSRRSATERIRSLGDVCYLIKLPKTQPKTPAIAP